MARLEQVTRAGYQVEVEWEWNFDSEIMPHHPELKTHPMIQHSPLNTRDALYGVRTEAMRLHYKVGERESIQYVDYWAYIEPISVRLLILQIPRGSPRDSCG